MPIDDADDQRLIGQMLASIQALTTQVQANGVEIKSLRTEIPDRMEQSVERALAVERQSRAQILAPLVDRQTHLERQIDRLAEALTKESEQRVEADQRGHRKREELATQLRAEIAPVVSAENVRAGVSDWTRDRVALLASLVVIAAFLLNELGVFS